MRAKRTLHTLVLMVGLAAGVVLCAGDRPAPVAGANPVPIVAAYWDTN